MGFVGNSIHNNINQRFFMFLTLIHPFLHDSPTILTPFLNKTVSSLALTFTLFSKSPMSRDGERARRGEKIVNTRKGITF
ncbi:hypothetical protein Peur_025674 [Populus x canadensis]